MYSASSQRQKEAQYIICIARTSASAVFRRVTRGPRVRVRVGVGVTRGTFLKNTSHHGIEHGHGFSVALLRVRAITLIIAYRDSSLNTHGPSGIRVQQF